jgi:NAD(P)-dependent dehydrogenase (short-subunit alcohol dehydrogenase family)
MHAAKPNLLKVQVRLAIARVYFGVVRSPYDRTFKTNVYAMFWITRSAMAFLKPGSAIINTASVNAYDPGKEIIDYAATKGAIMIFTKGLAKQVGPKGIRVNAVAPGPVRTALQVTGGQPPDKIPEFGADTPMGRPGQPAELAASMCSLPPPSRAFRPDKCLARSAATGGP